MVNQLLSLIAHPEHSMSIRVVRWGALVVSTRENDVPSQFMEIPGNC